MVAFDALHIPTANAQQNGGHELILSSGMPSEEEFQTKVLLDGGPDLELSDGSRFVTKTNGGAGPTKGYWVPKQIVDVYDKLGGADVLGPAEGRAFFDKVNRVTQPFQTTVIQYNPQNGQVEYDNVIDRLVALGKGDWLRAFKSIPLAADTRADQGLTWDQIVERHNALGVPCSFGK